VFFLTTVLFFERGNLMGSASFERSRARFGSRTAVACAAVICLLAGGLGSCSSAEEGEETGIESSAATPSSPDVQPPTAENPTPADRPPVNDPDHTLDWIPEGGLPAPLCPAFGFGNLSQGPMADRCLVLDTAEPLPPGALEEKTVFEPVGGFGDPLARFVDIRTVSDNGELFYFESGPDDADLVWGATDFWRFGTLVGDEYRPLPSPDLEGRTATLWSGATYADGLWAWSEGPADPLAPGDWWAIMVGNEEGTNTIVSANDYPSDVMGPYPYRLKFAGDWLFWTAMTPEGEDGESVQQLWAAPVDGTQKPQLVDSNVDARMFDSSGDGYCYYAVVSDDEFTIKRVSSDLNAQTVIAPLPHAVDWGLDNVTASGDYLAWSIQAYGDSPTNIVTLVNLATGATTVYGSATVGYLNQEGVSCTEDVCAWGYAAADPHPGGEYLVNMETEKVWRLNDGDPSARIHLNGTWVLWETENPEPGDGPFYPVFHVGQLDLTQL